jgi:hypothetical protein
MKGALPYPFYALKEACLPGIELFPAGTSTLMPYNPLMPVKLWRDSRPNLASIVQYRIVQVVSAGVGSGKAVLQILSMGRAWAQSLNIPSAAASEGPPGEPELPFPLRDLYEDEELAIGPGPMGGPVIRNRDLYAALVSAPVPPQDSLAELQILNIVKELLARMDRAGLK